MSKQKNNSDLGHDYNYKCTHSARHDKRKATDFRQLSFSFPIPGNDSIQSLSDQEIIARIERTTDPVQREKESPINVPAWLFHLVNIGLIEELKNRRTLYDANK